MTPNLQTITFFSINYTDLNFYYLVFSSTGRSWCNVESFIFAICNLQFAFRKSITIISDDISHDASTVPALDYDVDLLSNSVAAH